MDINKSIIFFGTPEFAVASLDKLLVNNFTVKAVVTTPDKPAGRGKKISLSPLKVFAIEKGIPILQPDNLKDIIFITELKKLNADLFIVVAFRKLPEDVWKMPPLGTFNLHASLLPDYRGAAPINWAIINGEKETGITTFFLNENIDEGKIIFSQKIVINETETYGELYNRMKIIGAELLTKTVDSIYINNVNTVEQNLILEKIKTINKAPKIQKSDCIIDWNNNSIDIVNKIRGLNPIPTAYTLIINDNDSEIYLKIFKAKAEIENHELGIGKIQTDNKSFLRISVPDGFVSLLEIQISGKNKVKIDDFLRGHRINERWRIK
jgi:methionyl-tRNA formyltransferase